MADNYNSSAADVETIEAGGSLAVEFWFVDRSNDGRIGCNFNAGSPAHVTIHVPAGASASPTSLTYSDCGRDDLQTVTFTSSTPGSYLITASATGGIGGTFSLTPAAFTLVVGAPGGGGEGGGGGQEIADLDAPVLSLPPDLTVEATGPSGATASWSASALDAVDGAVAVACSPASGSLFALGSATVSCSASDGAGNEATGSFQVHVVDTTPPTITSIAGAQDGASYHYWFVPGLSCEAEDLVSGPVPCAVSGAGTGVGAQAATLSATDDAGNEATQTVAYAVLGWTPTGFHSPVKAGAITAKAGSTIPLKWNVWAGATEITTTAAIRSITVDGAAVAATGATVLRYDAEGGQFVFNWKTPSARGVHIVTATMDDGSTISALVTLR